jgi:tetratricopeptide (TPR) repeat protein
MRSTIFVLPVLLLIFSCGTEQTAPTTDRQKQQDSLLNKIRGIESAMNVNMRSAVLDPGLASSAVKHYLDFAKAYPQDTNAPMFLFRAADIQCNAMRQYDQALASLEQVKKNYPDFRKLPVVYFQAGVIYDDHLNDDTRAKAAYEEFLKKFPGHPLAPQVTALISYLGKSNEELLKEFEQKNKAR